MRTSPYAKPSGKAPDLDCPKGRNGIHLSTEKKCAECLHHHCIPHAECPACYCTNFRPLAQIVRYKRRLSARGRAVLEAARLTVTRNEKRYTSLQSSNLRLTVTII